MKTYIITIDNGDTPFPDKVKEFTDRAAASCEEFGNPYELFSAVTPETFDEWNKTRGIHYDTNEVFDGKVGTLIACLASHISIMEKCIELNEPVVIMEQDAYYVRTLPDAPYDSKVIKLCGGILGHGYTVFPEFAKRFIKQFDHPDGWKVVGMKRGRYKACTPDLILNRLAKNYGCFMKMDKADPVIRGNGKETKLRHQNDYNEFKGNN